jgi:hypothetical protein
MKTENRLAGDENGFVVLAIILLAVAIAVIVLMYFWPFLTIGALLCVGSIFLLFNGTMEPKYALIMMVGGVVTALVGVWQMGVF